MLLYSQGDDGTYMNQHMLLHPSRLVGDGSYDPFTDRGSAAIILETFDQATRLSNAALVPTNTPSPTYQWNDLYRCELFGILLGLFTVHHMEIKFSSSYQPITVSVDNDSALDSSFLFDDPITVTDQHFDIISSTRSLRSHIRTPITHERVMSHRDRDVPFHLLTRPEQLNVECDLLAKFARIELYNFDHLHPSLNLPFESISIWHGSTKLYKDYNKLLLEYSYRPRLLQYYRRKYQRPPETFDCINWNVVDSAMYRVFPSTSKWICKLSSGFIGLAKTLALESTG